MYSFLKGLMINSYYFLLCDLAGVLISSLLLTASSADVGVPSKLCLSYLCLDKFSSELKLELGHRLHLCGRSGVLRRV